MGGACRMHRDDKKFIDHSGWTHCKEETIRMTSARGSIILNVTLENSFWDED
jgi:hypothetical protein